MHSICQQHGGLTKACDDLAQMLKNWTGCGKKVYLIPNMPVDNKCDSKLMIERNFFSPMKLNQIPLKADEWHKTATIANSELEKIAAKANATIINLTTYLCNEDECQVLTSENEPLYKDWCHLRPKFVVEYVSYRDKVLF